jgi:transposase
MGQRRKFSREFRLEAVRRVIQDDRGLSEVARELGISPSLLSHWKADFLMTEEPQKLPHETPEQEVRRLRHELERVRQERDFLKKAAAFFARQSE